MSADDAPQPSSRIEVVRGQADPATIAAVVVALTPAGGGGPAAPAGPTGWAAAALQEGVGGHVAAEPGDLRRLPGGS